MFLVDSHCHLDLLDLTPYQDDLTQLVAQCDKQGVKHLLCVCVTLSAFPRILQIAESFTSVSATVGIHPNEILPTELGAAEITRLAQHPKVVGIGETGLDYYRTDSQTAWQQERFRQHIEAARLSQLPLIIHTRQAQQDTIDIMCECNASASGGVMHCFTEDWSMAKKALDLGFYISISGIVTFKNATQVQAVAKNIPLDRLLIETDSPYLAPVPFRGQSNEPAYVRYVLEALAVLRGCDPVMLAEKTTDNFFQLFKKARRGETHAAKS